MGDKAKEIWSKTKETVGGLSKGVKAALIAVVVVALAAVAVVVAQSTNTKYAVLFTGLTPDDMTAVTKYLSDAGTEDYRVQDDDTIMVPAGQEESLKAKVLAAGYPTTGSGYSLYLGNISALSTESDRSTMTLYQLQDKLSGIIRRFDKVKDATVTITPGEDRRYVLGQDEALQASAAVVLTMEDDELLSESMADAIRNTVSNSVKGLVVDGVAISDTAGNTYDGANNVNGSTASKMKMEMEEQVNNKVRKQVLDVLEPMFGKGNVSVAVNSVVEVNTSRSESTEYSQPDWAGADTNGEGIVRHKEGSGEIVAGEDGVGGVPGDETNADFPSYVENRTPTGDEQGLSASWSKDYDNNKTITQLEQSGGNLVDLSVSVTLNSKVPNTANPADLVSHVARAAGIDAAVQDQKVSIITHEFYDPNAEVPADVTPIPNPFADLPLWVYLALLAGLFLFMLLFTVFVLLGRRRNRRRIQQLEPVVLGPELPEEEPEAPEEEPQPAGADIMDVHTERSMELRKSVRELAESNPEIAAQAIKALLRGDEEDNG